MLRAARSQRDKVDCGMPVPSDTAFALTAPGPIGRRTIGAFTLSGYSIVWLLVLAPVVLQVQAATTLTQGGLGLAGPSFVGAPNSPSRVLGSTPLVEGPIRGSSWSRCRRRRCRTRWTWSASAATRRTTTVSSRSSCARTVIRSATEDFEYHGLPITRGTFLTMCVSVAQRDPRAFPGGDSFDIKVARSSPILQFGAGPHHCLGEALARLEIAEALPVLASRLGPPSINGPVTWRPQIGIYGPNELPLRFG